MAVVTLLVGCNKEGGPAIPSVKDENKDLVSFKFSGTKPVTLSSNEDDINSVLVFVFNEDGTLDASLSSTDEIVTLPVSAGKNKTAYAILNPQSDYSRSVATIADLKTITDTRLNTTQGTALFGMAGKSDAFDVPCSSNEPISIGVDRMVLKVVLKKITNNLAPEIGALEVTNVFLSNIPVYGRYFDFPASDSFINFRGRNLSSYTWFTHGTVSVPISNGAFDETKYYFYSYENPFTADSTSEVVSSRYTRLIVETRIQGQTYFYIVSLNAFAEDLKLYRNRQYIVSLVVKNIGSLDPEVPTTPTSLDFTVQIVPWGENNLNYQID